MSSPDPLPDQCFFRLHISLITIIAVITMGDDSDTTIFIIVIRIACLF